MKPRETCYLSLGSNLGNREKYLETAGLEIRSLPRVELTGRSSVYETEPVGGVDQPWFLNQIIEIRTGLSPSALLAACLDIEKRQGRNRPFPGASRTLDIDILFYGHRVVRKKDLEIPHPRLHLRGFVLLPLADLCPERVHPVWGKTVIRMLEELDAPHTVRLYRPEDRRTIDIAGGRSWI